MGGFHPAGPHREEGACSPVLPSLLSSRGLLSCQSRLGHPVKGHGAGVSLPGSTPSSSSSHKVRRRVPRPSGRPSAVLVVLRVLMIIRQPVLLLEGAPQCSLWAGLRGGCPGTVAPHPLPRWAAAPPKPTSGPLGPGSPFSPWEVNGRWSVRQVAASRGRMKGSCLRCSVHRAAPPAPWGVGTIGCPSEGSRGPRESGSSPGSPLPSPGAPIPATTHRCPAGSGVAESRSAWVSLQDESR